MAKFIHHKKLALLLLVPQLAITGIFFIWPACSALIQSFYYEDAFGLYRHFAGFKNFNGLLHNADFINSCLITFLIAFWITILTMSLGLWLAVLVKNRQKSQSWYKSLALWPYAVAPAVAAILWRFLCQPDIGWFAKWLNFFGINFNYLTHPWQALTVVIVTASWQQLSYNFLFYFAALKAIPNYLVEAAILDGASGWRRFWQIIFPLLSPTTFFLLIMNFIYSIFDTFGIIDVMTNGGPAAATTTLIFKVYKDGFIGMDPGLAAAQCILLMLMVSAVTLVQFRYLDKKVHY